MSLLGQSLITFSDLTDTQIQSLFTRANKIADKIKNKDHLKQNLGATAALLFFEASTRTRLSFLTALSHMGLSGISIDGKAGTSMEKGETILDTILNVEAMGHELLIIRCGDDLDLRELRKILKTPLINAGWGKTAHPTQALLDLYTMIQKWGDLSGKKILIIGDILHSRVASSHFDLLKRWGLKIYVASPFGSVSDQVQSVDKIDEVLGDMDVVMSLRAQVERHGDGVHWPKDFHQKYGMNRARISLMKKDSLLMHPGPIHFGMEMDREIVEDPRCAIYHQVRNGVLIREALMREVVGL